MGVAILSGVLASLDARAGISQAYPHGVHSKWESHTPGTRTPANEPADPALPTRFLACVSREETARALRGTFAALGGLGSSVEVIAGANSDAIRQADVVLLW